jgi:predicted RNA-binding protein YlqC (UPF0109 family)
MGSAPGKEPDRSIPDSKGALKMQQLVEYLVKMLVDDPEAVSVSEVDIAGVSTYEVSVADGDLGRVIGRQGRIANALRTVVKASALKSGRRVSLEIVS